MNLVVDDAVEVKLATKTEEESRRQLGREILSLLKSCPAAATCHMLTIRTGQILLKGDNVSLIQTVQS